MSFDIQIVDNSWKTVDTFSVDQSIISSDLLDVKYNDLIYSFVRMQLNNARNTIASTKNRWEIRGSRKKLYKQKWTGSARAWDMTSPTRRKWAVAFGPRYNAAYNVSMPKRLKQLAHKIAFARILSEKNVVCLQDSPSIISTTSANKILSTLWLNNNKIIVAHNDKTSFLSYRNISNVQAENIHIMWPYELLRNKKVLFIWKESLITYIKRFS